jgi:hypothetical protein
VLRQRELRLIGQYLPIAVAGAGRCHGGTMPRPG